MTRRGGVYEHYLYDYLCDKKVNLSNTTVIDVGANFGFHALEFADLVGSNGTVYAFEPQRLVYYQLCGNIIMNGLHNVIAHNVALGDARITLPIENPNYFSTDTINIGNAHLNAYTANGSNLARVLPLDDYNLFNVSVIKIDVQGYESNVLIGATTTIRVNRPIIFIEVEEPQLNIYGKTSEDVFRILLNFGYRYQKLSQDNHIVDYVAIPS